jgi:hypothetical protein
MTNPKIIILQEKKDELHKILENYSQWSQVEIWIAGITSMIELQFPNYFEQFNKYCKEPSSNLTDLLAVIEKQAYSIEKGEFTRLTPNSSLNDLNRYIRQTSNLKKGQDAIRKLLNFLDTLIQLSSNELISNNSEDVLTILERIFFRFDRIYRQLQDRHDNRPTIKIDDEYDVQDLLHALLHLYFADIRSEVTLPQFAGQNSRVDFVLKQEKIMIEVKIISQKEEKKTSPKTKDKQLGTQLIDDIPRYKQYQDASTLIFFIYDPDNLMSNPQGIIDDIETHSNNDFLVKVFIYPRH